MEEKLAAMQEIMDKVIDINKLPSYGEAVNLLHYLHNPGTQSGYSSWTDFCIRHGVYNVHTTEFIDALADEIRRLNDSPIVEIGAGDGKLSYGLRMKGIDIKPTDNFSWGHSDHLVEKLSDKETLEKYQPKIVLASWIPHPSIGFNILNHAAVRYFICIGEDASDISVTTKDVKERKDWNMKHLNDAQRYAISKGDYKGRLDHTQVILFSRKDTSY